MQETSSFVRILVFILEMNSIFGKLNESKLSMESFTLTLQETRSIHDSMNIQKIAFIA